MDRRFSFTLVGNVLTIILDGRVIIKRLSDMQRDALATRVSVR